MTPDPNTTVALAQSLIHTRYANNDKDGQPKKRAPLHNANRCLFRYFYLIYRQPIALFYLLFLLFF